MATLGEGQRFERYRIIHELGSGVSGETYEAEDTMLLRKVALKLLHPWAPLFDLARRQFFREMQSISVLHHPYLASVLDYGEIDGKLYVARRYVSSGSLLSNDGRSWFHPPLSIPDALQYTQQLAHALDYIHKNGCLHGGLTFSNILVLRGPNVDHEADYAPFLLADVGLANYVRRFGQPQISPLPITTAPEQLGKRVVPTSDQFALAVVLYFWLTGRPPYLGTPDEIEHQKLTETITPLRSLNPSVTIEQEGIVLRALSVYPEDRYPSMLAFATALQAALASSAKPITSSGSVGTGVDMEKGEELYGHPGTWHKQEPDHHSANNSIPDIEPQPQPMPDVPQPLPDPNTPQIMPEPLHEPDVPETEPGPDVPAPTPNPIPQPEPDIPEIEPKPDVPEPEPNPIPQPVPDVPQPLPEPNLPQPSPQILPQAETTTGETLRINSEPLPTLPYTATTIPARVIITSPYSDEPHEILLEHDEITLGRAGSSDILLDQDNLTSRHHALLKHEGNHYILYDRRSANGVFVNGQKLSGDEGYMLLDGDHISIGNYELIFRTSIPKAFDEKDYEAPQSAIPNMAI